jgi:hypothetical protein
MALVALQEQSEGFTPFSTVIQTDTSGNVWIDGKPVTRERIGMSMGYVGPNAEFVHPHERAVDMRSEWDAKLGPSGAERKRRAWNDSTPVKPDAVESYVQCGSCGIKIPVSFKAQHHRESPRCQGTVWIPT